MKRTLLFLVCIAVSGCATNFTTRIDPDGTKTTQRTITTVGMGNNSQNETIVIDGDIEMRSGANQENRITPEQAAALINFMTD